MNVSVFSGGRENSGRWLNAYCLCLEGGGEGGVGLDSEESCQYEVISAWEE